MITYGDNTSYKHAEVGDKFCVIEYFRFGFGVSSAIDYTVKKVGKRDINCVSKNGRELTVKVKDTYTNPKAYIVGGEESKLAIESIRKKNRLNEALKLIGGSDNTNRFDDALLTAIEEWHERIQKSEGNYE